jgi:hypothetical protein
MIKFFKILSLKWERRSMMKLENAIINDIEMEINEAQEHIKELSDELLSIKNPIRKSKYEGWISEWKKHIDKENEYQESAKKSMKSWSEFFAKEIQTIQDFQQPKEMKP